ncbi:MAG: TlpA family protein disulfide reductase [Bacteriovoracaceae bacterium]
MGTITKYLCLSFIIMSCGRGLPVTERKAFNPVEKTNIETLMGTFSTLDNEKVNLEELDARPTLVIIAAESCITCRKEAQGLVKLFTEQGSLPQNINLYTVVLGGYLDDARAWAKSLKINWTVGVQLEGDSLYENYCNAEGTPCVLAFNPTLKTLTKFVGESSIEDWQKETGKWEF